MKIKIKALFSGLLLLLAGPAFSQTDADAASRLVDLLSGLETMRAEVAQLTLDQEGREVQEAEATLTMHRPDRFYWHTTVPYEEVMTTDGESIWIYEPDLDQVTVQDFSEDVSRTPALLLSEDEETLRESFSITLDDVGGGRSRFTLVPRDPGSLFEILSMTFSDGKLEEMQFSDSLGQRTSLEFSEVETNLPVDQELFTFEAPDGVEVIDSRRP